MNSRRGKPSQPPFVATSVILATASDGYVTWSACDKITIASALGHFAESAIATMLRMIRCSQNGYGIHGVCTSRVVVGGLCNSRLVPISGPDRRGFLFCTQPRAIVKPVRSNDAYRARTSANMVLVDTLSFRVDVACLIRTVGAYPPAKRASQNICKWCCLPAVRFARTSREWNMIWLCPERKNPW